MSDNPITISVIIPVYNAAQHLSECLDSLLNQTLKDLEIICINDGSTDSSLEILREYSQKDSRVIVIDQKNSGQGATRNRALEISRGEFITGLDSDDYLAPDCYEIALRHMTEEVDMVVYGSKPFGSNKDVVDEFARYLHIESSGHVEVNVQTIGLITNVIWNKIFRRSIIEQYSIRFPEKVWYEDMAFIQMYSAVIRQTYMIAQNLHFYRIHSCSVMGKTRQRNAKAMDILPATEAVFDFYCKHNLWQSFLPQIEKLTNTAIWRLDSVPPTMRLRAKVKLASFVKKWDLQSQFPKDKRLNILPTNTLDIINQFINEVFGKANRSGSLVGRNTGDIGHSYSETRMHRLFCCVPLLSTRTSYYHSKRLTKTRYKLFGLIPILLVRRGKKEKRWLLFHFIPIWNIKYKSTDD